MTNPIYPCNSWRATRHVIGLTIYQSKSIAFFVFIFFLFGCKDNKVDRDTVENAGNDAVVECFAYQNPRDTILLKLIPMGESVTGTLVYVLGGKDRNTGTIQGVIRENLLVANYTFMSEGIRSVRQVAFRKQDNYYIEGYGDINTEGDITRFHNTDSLWFNDAIRLVPSVCQ